MEPKKGLMIAIGLGKPKGYDKGPPEAEAESEDMGGEESTPDQLEAAMGLIDAIKAKDPDGVVMAYKALKYTCEEEYESEPASERKPMRD